MALPDLGPFANTAMAASTVSSLEDSNKKIRKPYTITKSRESWTDPEHDKFLEALQLFDRDWKKIEAFISSKTVIQKASKTAHGHPQVLGSFPSSTALLDAGYALRSDPTPMLVDPITSAAVSSWTSSAKPVSFSQEKNGLRLTNNSCSSSEDILKMRQIEEITDQRNNGHALRVLPDFAQVYSFIGGVFDPKATGHLRKLTKMDPIDVETVLLLMRNLAINLASPDFEDHRRLLSSYEVDTDTSDGSVCKAVDKEQSKSITYNWR